MKFTRKYSVLVPFCDVNVGNIFKKGNSDILYIKTSSCYAVSLNGGDTKSSDFFYECGIEILGENFEDFIEKLKKNEYKKKKFEYLLSRDIIFGSLFECDDEICMKLNMDGLAVCIDDGRVIQLDKDRTYRIIKDYKMEIFE